jgi:hypothetical protein
MVFASHTVQVTTDAKARPISNRLHQGIGTEKHTPWRKVARQRGGAHNTAGRIRDTRGLRERGVDPQGERSRYAEQQAQQGANFLADRHDHG